MLLSAVSVLVVAQSSSEIPEGLMNNPVFSNPPMGAFVLLMSKDPLSRDVLYIIVPQSIKVILCL